MVSTWFKTMGFTLTVLTVLWASSATQASNGKVEVRLWDQATVTRSSLRLDDIATITGQDDDTAAIRRFMVSTGLMENQPVLFRAWDISRRLDEAGFDSSSIKITGAARCEVNFVQPKDKKNETVKRSEDAVSITKAAHLSGPATLETKIRQMICDRLSDKGLSKEAKILINFNPILQDLLTLTEPPYRFVVEPQQRNTEWMGLVGLSVKVFKENSLVQTVPILVQVQVKLPVIIANKSINSKARITRDDIKVSWKELTQMNTKSLPGIDEILECQAKRMIPLGATVTTDMLESVPLVRHNQLVTVLYRKSGLEVTLVGKALDNAGRNNWVKVRNERSKEIFHARVIGEGKVVVESSPSEGSPAVADSTGGSL